MASSSKSDEISKYYWDVLNYFLHPTHNSLNVCYIDKFILNDDELLIVCFNCIESKISKLASEKYYKCSIITSKNLTTLNYFILF